MYAGADEDEEEADEDDMTGAAEITLAAAEAYAEGFAETEEGGVGRAYGDGFGADT